MFKSPLFAVLGLFLAASVLASKPETPGPR